MAAHPASHGNYHHYADNGGYGGNYLQPLSCENGFQEINHEVHQQLPPMSSFSHAISQDDYHQPCNSLASQDPALELLSNIGCVDTSGLRLHHQQNDDVYQPPFDSNYGFQQYSDAAYEQNHDHEILDNFLSTADPHSSHHTGETTNYHLIANYTTISSVSDSQSHSQNGYNGYSIPEVQDLPSLNAPVSRSHLYLSTDTSQLHHSNVNDSQYAGHNQAASGVDLFATLGITDDLSLTLDAESLIESYGCEVTPLSQSQQPQTQHVLPQSCPPHYQESSQNWSYQVPSRTPQQSGANASSVNVDGSSPNLLNLQGSAQSVPVLVVQQSRQSSLEVNDQLPPTAPEAVSKDAHAALSGPPQSTTDCVAQVERVAISKSPVEPNSDPSSQSIRTTQTTTTPSVDTTVLIEETKCYKCVVCEFICLQKTGVLNHIGEKHQSNGELLTALSLVKTSVQNEIATTYMCSKCLQGFPSLGECTQHMSNAHSIATWSLEKLPDVQEPNQKHDSLKQSSPNLPKSPSMITTLVNNLPLSEPAAKVVSRPSAKAASQMKPILPSNGAKRNMSTAANPRKRKRPSATSKGAASNSVAVPKSGWDKKPRRDRSYFCQRPGCTIRYEHLDNLEYHQKCHRDSGNGFACIQCDKFSSDSWASTAGHLWRKHGIDLEMHKCEFCSYRSYLLSNLENIHKKIHSTEKNYICSVCSKGFKNHKQLVNHAKRHTTSVEGGNGEKKKKAKSKGRHECDLCGRCFDDARPLRAHMDQVHKKLRPYVCSQCGYSASSRSALRTHIRSHTGEKPFKCDQCAYSASDHNALRRHKMRHSGERPYKCPFCDYACIQVSPRAH